MLWDNPSTLKHRGVFGKTEKLLKIPYKLSTPKKPVLKVNNDVLKFNAAAISDFKLEKSNHPSVSLKSKGPVNMEMIENMLQAATIKRSDNAVEPKQSIKIKTATTATTKSLKPLIENQMNSSAHSIDDSNVISPHHHQQRQQQQLTSTVTIKKKSVNTIGTAKLSYSTITKSKSLNDTDNKN